MPNLWGGGGYIELEVVAEKLTEELARSGEQVILADYLEQCPACKWAPKIKQPLWLADLREVFARMRCAGVPDTEHYPEAKFRRYLKQYRLPEISLFAPCECTTK